MVDEVLVNDLVDNGLDEKCYGLVMEKGYVVVSFKRESLSHVKSLELYYDYENVCIQRVLRSHRGGIMALDASPIDSH